jgi:hypothetical protein
MTVLRCVSAAFLCLLASGFITRAHAITNVVIANNSGAPIYLNGTRPLPHARATWSQLNLRMDVPHLGTRIRIVDTSTRCQGSGWRINIYIDPERGPASGGFACVHLRPLETGCVAVRVDQDRVSWNDVHWTHCSDQWWQQNRGAAVQVFTQIARLALGAKALPLALAPMMPPNRPDRTWSRPAPPPPAYQPRPQPRPQPQGPAVADVEVGPIWNNDDARNKCPRAAAATGGRWTGHWRTTVWGEMSVCQVQFR